MEKQCHIVIKKFWGPSAGCLLWLFFSLSSVKKRCYWLTHEVIVKIKWVKSVKELTSTKDSKVIPISSSCYKELSSSCQDSLSTHNRKL